MSEEGKARLRQARDWFQQMREDRRERQILREMREEKRRMEQLMDDEEMDGGPGAAVRAAGRLVRRAVHPGAGGPDARRLLAADEEEATAEEETSDDTQSLTDKLARDLNHKLLTWMHDPEPEPEVMRRDAAAAERWSGIVGRWKYRLSRTHAASQVWVDLFNESIKPPPAAAAEYKEINNKMLELQAAAGVDPAALMLAEGAAGKPEGRGPEARVSEDFDTSLGGGGGKTRRRHKNGPKKRRSKKKESKKRRRRTRRTQR